MPQYQRDSEDMDDIISSIMHGQATPAKARVIPQNNRVRKTKARKINKLKLAKFVMLPLVFLALAAIVSSLLFSLVFKSPAETKFSQINKDLNFTLYQPSTIPDGYTLNPDDIRKDQNLIFITLKHKSGEESKQIVIAQQVKPDRDIEALYPPEKRPTAIITSQGKMYVNEAETSRASIIVTETSWVTISTSNEVESNLVEQLANSMVQT